MRVPVRGFGTSILLALVVALGTVALPSAPAFAATVPGHVRNLSVDVTSIDRGTGDATLTVSFDAASTGGPTDHYQVDECTIAGGSVVCSTPFAPLADVPAGPAHVVVPGPIVCPAGLSSCAIRVRGVDSTNTLFGTYTSANAIPWAPYNVGATSGPGANQVTLQFSGPSESGANGSRHYVAYVCRTSCGSDANWSNTGLVISYPQAGPGPYSSPPYNCGANTTCRFRMQFVDGAGAMSTLSGPVASAVGPTLTIDQPAPGAVTNDPTVSGTCSIGLGTVTATINPGANVFMSPCSGSGTWSVSIVSLPDANDTATASQPPLTAGPVSFTYDSTAPVTTDDTGAIGSGWHAAPVTVTLSPTDNLSGVAATYYTTNGSTPTTGSASGTSINLTADGVYTIKYFSVDAAGNTESVKTAGTQIRIDQTAPVTTDNTGAIGSGWHTAPVTVTLSPTDNLSGVAATYYTTNGSTPTTGSASGTSINLTADGVYTIKYFSVDVAGNAESVKTAGTQIRVDQTAPVITLTPANGARVGHDRWIAECATPGICGSVTDATSGVASFGPATVRRLSDGFYWNGTAFKAPVVNAPVTGTAAAFSIAIPVGRLDDGVSYTVTMHATDVAGNATTTTSTFTYDTTKPTVVSIATGNHNGAIGIGDSFAVTFSEAMDPASVPASATLTMSRTASNFTKYDISDLTSGPLTTGSTGYVTAATGTRSVTYTGTLVVSGSTVTFTVTTGCTSGCAFATAGAGAGAFSYKPAPTLADRAGNPPTTTTITSGSVVMF